MIIGGRRIITGYVLYMIVGGGISTGRFDVIFGVTMLLLVIVFLLMIIVYSFA